MSCFKKYIGRRNRFRQKGQIKDNEIKCISGKRYFKTENKAILSMENINKRAQDDHLNRAYQCELCGGYHLTKKDILNFTSKLLNIKPIELDISI